MLSFDQALNIVKEKLAAANLKPGMEVLPLDEARGRVLAEDVVADRDYPPFHRSIRDDRERRRHGEHARVLLPIAVPVLWWFVPETKGTDLSAVPGDVSPDPEHSEGHFRPPPWTDLISTAASRKPRRPTSPANREKRTAGKSDFTFVPIVSLGTSDERLGAR